MTWKCARRGHSFRRSQRRSDLRSRKTFEIRARARHPPLHGALSDWFGPERDIPLRTSAPTQQTMAWVMDTYAMHVRQATTAVVTGKPLELGGSQGRKEATGRGVMICCDKALAKLKMKRDGCRVIVQGFGNVGSQASLLMHAAGYKIIGAADIHGGLYNEKGIDIPKVYDWVYTQRQAACRNSPARGKNILAGSPLPAVRHSDSRRHGKPDHRARMPAASIAEFFAKARTAPPRRTPMPIIEQEGNLRHSGYSRPTPAASPSATSSGCRIARDFSGAKAK